MQHVGMAEVDTKPDLLDTKIKLNLSLNDLRLIVNCFRAIDYHGKLDDEPYLDEDGIALKDRLTATYGLALNKLGL